MTTRVILASECEEVIVQERGYRSSAATKSPVFGFRPCCVDDRDHVIYTHGSTIPHQLVVMSVLNDQIALCNILHDCEILHLLDRMVE
jgi:hypothetical protein